MSGFKEMLQNDLTVFFNQDEFAETRLIDGKEMVIVIDDEELAKRKSSASNPTDGIYNAALLFYVRKSDFDEKPEPGQHIEVEHEIYRVATIEEDAVMYTIALERNGTYW